MAEYSPAGGCQPKVTVAVNQQISHPLCRLTVVIGVLEIFPYGGCFGKRILHLEDAFCIGAPQCPFLADGEFAICICGDFRMNLMEIGVGQG